MPLVKFSEYDMQIMVDLRESYASDGEIAKELGVRQDAVRNKIAHMKSKGIYDTYADPRRPSVIKSRREKQRRTTDDWLQMVMAQNKRAVIERATAHLCPTCRKNHKPIQGGSCWFCRLVGL